MTVSCPLCSHRAPERFLVRESVPVHQNLLLPTREAALAVPRGRLDLHVCPACGFVFNASFDASLLSYGASYDNNQNHSAVFTSHVESLVAELISREAPIKHCRIAEIGCGDGAFLRRLVQPAEYGNVGFGFDPSYRGPDEDCGGTLQFRRTFYDERAADIQAEVILCRHVIEHVPDPLTLLRSIRQTAKSTAVRLFFETPCVDWILERTVVWDLFYEHCSLFTLSSLGFAFQSAGFEVTAARHVFNGQYLWVEGRSSVVDAIPTSCSGRTVELAARFATAEQAWRSRWLELMDELHRLGPVGVWGAGAKGVTFCNFLDPTASKIRCVVDVNPHKQGRFIAGSAHPIVGPTQLRELGIQHVLVLNPNYAAEIRMAATAQGLEIGIHDLMSHSLN